MTSFITGLVNRLVVSISRNQKSLKFKVFYDNYIKIIYIIYYYMFIQYVILKINLYMKSIVSKCFISIYIFNCLLVRI